MLNYYLLTQAVLLMKKIDGKESNTANGVNIATEFNEFKDVLFSKKIDEISLSCSDYKRFALDFFFFLIFFYMKILIYNITH